MNILADRYKREMQMSVALAQFQLSTFRFHLSLIHLHHQRRGGTPLSTSRFAPFPET
jgi:hypothetical protein